MFGPCNGSLVSWGINTGWAGYVETWVHLQIQDPHGLFSLALRTAAVFSKSTFDLGVVSGLQTRGKPVQTLPAAAPRSHPPQASCSARPRDEQWCIAAGGPPVRLWSRSCFPLVSFVQSWVPGSFETGCIFGSVAPPAPPRTGSAGWRRQPVSCPGKQVPQGRGEKVFTRPANATSSSQENQSGEGRPPSQRGCILGPVRGQRCSVSLTPPAPSASLIPGRPPGQHLRYDGGRCPLICWVWMGMMLESRAQHSTRGVYSAQYP